MALWLDARPLMLASKSAARRALLEAAGIPIEIEAANIDERGIEARAGLSDPEEVAALLAREKAKAVAAKHPGRLVLGADQTLALGARRFSKAADRAGALQHAHERPADAAAQRLAAGPGGGRAAPSAAAGHLLVHELRQRRLPRRDRDAPGRRQPLRARRGARRAGLPPGRFTVLPRASGP